jgi:cellulose synthase/poly-beta-1,6-N-acetylglucosamine synthase-like glycosyltransferase
MFYLFWLSTGLIVYTFAGYPIAIWLIGWIYRASSRQDGFNTNDNTHLPDITVVIPAYNEAGHIAAKVSSLRASNYPQDKMRILYISDGSTDDTPRILAGHADIDVLEYPQRRGKPYALNLAMENVTTPVVVFTDARQAVAPDAIVRLVRALMDIEIGAVSGELVHYDSASRSGKHVGLYWLYEKWIRKSESLVHSVAGVTGALYAINAQDYANIREDTILDDFEIPIHILKKGKRIVLVEGAELYDTTQEDPQKEKQRKIRTLSGNYQSFSRNRWLFNPYKNPIWIQFISHKVMRLIVPYFMLMAFIAPFFLQGWLYNIAIALQCLFYVSALLGKVLPKFRDNKLISFCYVFFELNVSSVISLKRYFSNQLDVRWNKM